METAVYIICAVVLAVSTVWPVLLGRRKDNMHKDAMDSLRLDHERELARIREDNDRIIERLRADYDNSLRTLREDHEKSVSVQLEGVKSAMAAENARLQKQNEESLKKEAAETFRTITGGMDAEIRKK